MCKLVAYALMSANDAPERDPMDWYDHLTISLCNHSSLQPCDKD